MTDARKVEMIRPFARPIDATAQPDSSCGIETTQPDATDSDTDSDNIDSSRNDRDGVDDSHSPVDHSLVNFFGLGSTSPRLIDLITSLEEVKNRDESEGNSEEILVLDEVGVCEDMTVRIASNHEGRKLPPCSNHLIADANAATTVSDKAGQVDDVDNDPETSNKARNDDGTDKMDQDVDDDILSIMCDDVDLDHLDLEEEEKRDWNFECGLRSSKRKSDSHVNSSSTSRPKRLHTELFISHSERRVLMSNSVHSRLGLRPKCYQDIEHNTNPCYRFLKTGSCYRPSCPFLHVAPTPQDNNRETRYQQPEKSDQMQLAQHVQQELHQMKKQQNFLLHHVQHNEALLKHHAVNQAQQVYTNLRNLYQNLQKEYEDKLTYNLSVFTGKLYSMNNVHCKNLQGIDERLKKMESALKTKDELLSHYKYFTNIQEKQMDCIISGCIIHDTSKGSLGHKYKLSSCPSMMEMDYLPTLDKSESRPCGLHSTNTEDEQSSTWGDWHKVCVAQSPNPRSVDNHPSTRISQNGQLADSEINHPQRLYLGQPADTKDLIERPVYNVAGNPHLMPFVPMRHFKSAVYDYQHASMKFKVP